MTSWFYWSEAQRNVKGEDLATCLHLYGTGERDDDRHEGGVPRRDTLHGILVAAHGHTRGHPRAGSPVEADPNTFKVLGAPPTSAAVVKQ
jgi:hypothetical protein